MMDDSKMDPEKRLASLQLSKNLTRDRAGA